ncbi:PaaI family thioesterase [Nocardia sp. NPDC051030]|uniref:PaaI family thioesterase n=1 Tax=Nocardia sp. NPDC051030 TaxID=3155162 RepID=UPI00341A37E7
MTEAEPRIIPEYAHGYPGVAFGGYVAGLLAGRSSVDTVRVDFRRAVLVETPLLLTASSDGRTAFTSPDDTLLVEATPAELTIDPLPAPSWSDAKRATETALTSPARVRTDCFGCGIDSPRGLRLFPWSVKERQLIVAAWTPDPTLGDEHGNLPPELVWSALDCPGGLAAWIYSGMGRGALTAALTATQLRPIPAGADYISHAWPLHRDGRKHTVAVALSTSDGELCALAEALWIEPRTD